MKQFLNSRRYNGRVQDNANQMKILMVSDAGSIHTERWTAALKGAGMDIVLFSITPAPDDFYEKNSIKLYFFDLFRYKKEKNVAKFSRFISHVKAVNALKKVIREEKPDILHAHYATSYGLVAALAGFHPLVVSVWGSDVYEFPKQSKINGLAVKFTLGRADRVLSTSMAMAEETKKYYGGDIGITPFGVDTALFSPAGTSSGGQNDCFTFGTVKTLSRRYGIDILLRAFAEAKRRIQDTAGGSRIKLKLIIAGRGKDESELKSLASELGIVEDTVFTGAVPHEKVPEIYSHIDVAIFLSREESFGVAAVEAMACGCPVIASDAEGFKEILEGGAGIIVRKENWQEAAEAMVSIASDKGMRKRLASAGRKRVLEKYDWNSNVATMTEEYRKLAPLYSRCGETEKKKKP